MEIENRIVRNVRLREDVVFLMIGSVTDRRGHGKTILILGMPVDGETRPIKRQMLISTT